MRAKILSLSLAVMFLVSTCVFSAEVGLKTAADVAKSFFYEQVGQERGMAYESIYILDHHASANNGLTDYRIFNFQQGGWVIVSGDDLVYPIIAYNPDGYFDPAQLSPSLSAWMDAYADNIAYYRQMDSRNLEVDQLWTRYSSNMPALLGRPDGSRGVDAFLPSNWGQGKYYNALCPPDNQGEAGHALVGCVATSMSQVMHYYRHPVSGTGSHGYTANNSGSGYGDYGYLFVDFSATTYDWDGMNDVVNGNNANLAVAELCHHAGVSVNMAYGPNASGSQTSYAAAALKNYFGYSSSLGYIQRYMYSNTSWNNILQANLNTMKPVVYSGTQVAGSGHAWVLDGWETTAQGDYYHCNWGWDGMSNGFFYLDNLAPGGEAPFSANQGAIVNIYPAGSYPPSCGSTKDVTARTGSITDGSGPLAYGNNKDCYWLIHPSDSVTKFILSFDRFDVADDNDVVTIYDGPSTSSPVLGTFNLSNAPSASLTSTASKVLVHFVTDGSGEAAGWQLQFRGLSPSFCSSSNLNNHNGTITDGSGSANYAVNSTCSWLIQPPFAKDLKLHFTSFDVAEGDFINVYDWGSQTILLSKYTGNTPPADIIAPSGAMYIEFKTDWAWSAAGWEAEYTTGNVGIEETLLKNLSVYPIPANERLHVSFTMEDRGTVILHLTDMTGRSMLRQEAIAQTGEFSADLDIASMPQGVYFLTISHPEGSMSRKVVIE